MRRQIRYDQSSVLINTSYIVVLEAFTIVTESTIHCTAQSIHLGYEVILDIARVQMQSKLHFVVIMCWIRDGLGDAACASCRATRDVRAC